MSVFAERLQDLRKQAGLSQQALARELGVAQGSISNYEKRGRRPDVGFLVRLADRFGVTTDWLLGREEAER